MVQSLWFVFSQPQEAASSEGAVQVLLGRDSPNLGGNTFRDAFIAMTLSDTLGVEVSAHADPEPVEGRHPYRHTQESRSQPWRH